jgi:glycosyltransferase involved in cell wall biosynthesis
MHGCGYLRSYLPAKHLGGHYLGGFDRAYPFIGMEHVFLQRHIHSDFLEIIDNLHSLGIKVHYDLDDNLWNVDLKNPAKKGYTPQVLNTLENIIAKCDSVYTSTVPLKDKLTEFHSCVNIVPNLIEIPRLTRKELKSTIRIGYGGSISHEGDFSKPLISAIKKLKHKLRDKIEFVFVGYVPEALKSIVTFHAGAPTSDYLEFINYLDFDIAISPLKDTIFNQAKSNLKWLDYSACEVCTVASNVCSYQDIEHMVTGVLVDENWYEVLSFLIENKKLTKEIALSAKKHVTKEFSWGMASCKQRDVYNATL